MTPPGIKATLDSYDGSAASVGLAGILSGQEGSKCAGARFHSPSPLLLSRFGVERGEFTVVPPGAEHGWVLCGTCASNVRMLVALLRIDGDLPWSTRREFGNEVRRIGTQVHRLTEEQRRG